MTGVDFLDANVNVCKILAKENPELKVEFICARIEDFISNLEPNKFDVVLGLSVFHHLCFKYGWVNVRNLIANLAEKVTFGIFELALRKEPVNWAPALPNNYRELLTGFDFVRLIAYNDTHLSDFKRPLCLTSKKYVYVEEFGCLKNDSAKRLSHDYAPTSRIRRYFFCGDKFVKSVSAIDNHDIKEMTQEINFLKEMGGKNGFPQLLSANTIHYEEDVEFWIVREKLDGVLLSEKFKSGESVDSWNIIKQILKILVMLEEKNYYYDDLRVWNVIVDDKGKATLIDYGAIGNEPKDVAAPYNLAMSFFLFMNEVFERTFKVQRQVKFLTSLKKYIPAEKYRKMLEVEDSGKIFAQLYGILFEDNAKTNYTLAEREILAVEDCLNDITNRVAYQSNRLDNLEMRVANIENFLRELTARIKIK